MALIDAPERFELIAGFPIAAGLGDGYRSADVSSDWVRDLRTATDPDIWRYGVFAIDRASGIAVGVGGFKGPPDETGTAEIAYGVSRAHEGRGFATEIAAALTAFAFEDPGVTCVIAHTMPKNVASSRVLEKCGFTSPGRVIDPDDGEVLRWEKHPHRTTG